MPHELTEEELAQWEQVVKGYPEDHHERLVYEEMIPDWRNKMAFGIPVVVDDDPRHRPKKTK